MKNLREEILEIIEKEEKLENHLQYVAIDGLEVDLKDLLQVSDFHYDSGYGASYINNSLIIVFSDGSHYTRHEYDGSEWFGKTVPPKRPKEKLIISSVEEMNQLKKSLVEKLGRNEVFGAKINQRKKNKEDKIWINTDK